MLFFMPRILSFTMPNQNRLKIGVFLTFFIGRRSIYRWQVIFTCPFGILNSMTCGAPQRLNMRLMSIASDEEMRLASKMTMGGFLASAVSKK
jgi:hypothetical protein